MLNGRTAPRYIGRVRTPPPLLTEAPIMDHPLLRRAWIALAIAAVIPAAVLAVTFHPAFLPHAAGRSVALVRLACGLSLAGVAVLFALRRRIDALLLRVD